jgi:hypothetical protein
MSEAIAVGQLKQGTNPVLPIDALNGPLFLSVIAGLAPLDKRFAERVFEKVIPGFEPQ